MSSIGNYLLLFSIFLLTSLLVKSCHCFPPPHPKSQFLSGSRFPSEHTRESDFRRQNENENEDLTVRSSLSQTIQSILNPKFPGRDTTTTTTSTTTTTAEPILAILEISINNQSFSEISSHDGNVTAQGIEILESTSQNTSTPDENVDEERKKLYDEKLKTVLGNIQIILPILSRLEFNMTDLLAHSPLKNDLKEDDNEIQEITTTTSIPSQILPTFETPTLKTQERSFEFPSPSPSSSGSSVSNSVQEENDSTALLLLLKNLYPKKEFSETAQVLNTLPLKSQEFAYGQLADFIINSYRNKSGASELIELTCQLEGKSRFKKILDKHDIIRNVILPGFFQYPTNRNNNNKNNENNNDGLRGNFFQLEARTKSDGPKNLYFDRRNNKIGITNNDDLLHGIFQSWTFLPVRDGCYFVLKSSESDIILGVVVTQSRESALLAKNVVGVTGLPEGKTNYRFQWKVVPHQVKGKDRTHLLLENRETSLILEWNEFDEVHLNPYRTFDSQQLWVAV